MSDAMIEEFTRIFPEKMLLTVQDVCSALECDEQTVYNWNKRQDSRRRPPRILIGKQVRFPKRSFVEWLLQEQGRVA